MSYHHPLDNRRVAVTTLKGIMLLLVCSSTALCYGQPSMYIEEFKQPGDLVRILVTFPEETTISDGVATFQLEGHEGECPTTLQLKQEIAASQMKRITPTQYSFSVTVGNNASGRYKLTKIVARSGGKQRQYFLGRDFQAFSVGVSNPQQNQICCGSREVSGTLH
jgi:hypothetical protein